MKVNLGAGYKRFDGFVNVDMDAATNPDFVADVGKDRLPFDDSTVDEIIAHHIFEHLGGDTFFHCLKELYRVCKDGAVIDVHVPHFRHDYFYGDPTHVRPITIEMMNRFSKRYNDNELSGNPGTTPFAYQVGVDFEIVWHEYQIEDWFTEQYKEAPEDVVNLAARIYNNVIQEIHFKMVVKK
jgi:predicted SAM-dependent methyltransferase